MLLMRQQICSRRPIQAPTGVFPPNESAGLSARSCVTSLVHEAFLRAIFCPSRASSPCFSQAPGASRSQHRLSSFLLMNYGSHGCNAVESVRTRIITGLLTPGVASPLQKQYLTRSNKDSIVFRPRLKCIRVRCVCVGGVHSHPEPDSSPPILKSYPLHR